MKKIVVAAILMAAGGITCWRSAAQASRTLSELMPEGALLYLESPDFARLVREWNGSKVKRDWLASANYAAFSRSNLFAKLAGVYDEYGAAAGFGPNLDSVIEIAGDESAVALYEIRDVEFLYISHVPQNRLAASQLWRVRDKFEQRQAAGIPFYIRTAGGRTIAFTFANDYLLLATRDDLMARALALLSGARDPSVASSRWFERAVNAQPDGGELRLALNMDALLKSSYFRSHWIYRNAAQLRPYESGIVSVTRDPNQVLENRIFLRHQDAAIEPAAADARQDLAELLSSAPASAGLVQAWAAPQADFVAAKIERKLLAPEPSGAVSFRYAPQAIIRGEAGAESDLETRIDEPALPANSSGALVTGPLRNLLQAAQIRAMMQIQSAVAQPNGFVGTPCVLVVQARGDWDVSAVDQALARAIETLWTTSGLGARWVPGTAGAHAIERLDGLAPLFVSARGHILFLANDAGLLASVLDAPAPARAGSASAVTYAAQFRHGVSRGPYRRLASALDFGRCSPCFFSDNIASLSDTLSFVDSVDLAESDRGDAVVQRVTYRLR